MSNNGGIRDSTATKQAVLGRDARGRFTRGNVPKVGFHTHPERRSNGSWKKENTPRAKLEKLLTDATLGELLMQINEHNVVSNFDEEVGNVLISERLANTFSVDADGKIKINSKELDSLLYFVYGKRTESEASISTQDNLPSVPQFVIPTLPKSRASVQHVISE